MSLQASLEQGSLAQMKNQVLALSTSELEELARYIEDVLATRVDAKPRHVIVGNVRDTMGRSFEPSRDFPGKAPDIFLSENGLPEE